MKKLRIVKLLVVLCLVIALIPVAAFAAETGWVENADGTKSYMLDGALVTGFFEIDGKYYSFSYNGKLRTNIEFMIGNDRYRARADGSLYVNEWYQPDPDKQPNLWYYYGEGGKAVTGWVNVEGIERYFREKGRMTCDEILTGYDYENKTNYTYYFDTDGRHTELTDEGWTTLANGRQVYIVDRRAYVHDVYSIDGTDYIFDEYGFLAKENYSLETRDPETRERYYCRAQADGTPYRDTWVQPYLNDPAYAEYSEEYRTRWYYYGADGRALSGIQFIDGKYYVFMYDGEARRGYCDYVSEYDEASDSYTDVLYHFSEINGAGMRLVDNAWNLLDHGEKIYMKNGKTCIMCAEIIDGVMYVFGSDRYLLEKDEVLRTYDEVTNTNRSYRAKEGGVAYINEWVAIYKDGEDAAPTMYYYGENGLSAYGYTKIGENFYYFDTRSSYGEMKRNCSFGTFETDETGNKVLRGYVCDENGIATRIMDGWQEFSDGGKLYFKDGTAYYGSANNIDGVWYGFDENGNMYDDEAFTIGSDYYRAKSGGALYVNEWYELYYYGEEGKAAVGYTKIGENYHYFDANGVMQKDRSFSILETDENGNEVLRYYTCDENGIAIRSEEGWKLLSNGKYMYFKNGTAYKDGVYDIDGTWYGFDEYGYMYNNTRFRSDNYTCYYRAKEGGALYVNEWCQPYPESWPDVWYYYGEAGKAANGYTKVGEVYYYFESDGKMMTDCSFEVDGKAYFCDVDGVAVKLKYGWNLLSNGEWMYIQNGKRCMNEVVFVDRVWYGFDENGYMYNNEEFRPRGDSYYYRAKEGGALYVKEWYAECDEKGNPYWFYYGAGGKAAKDLTLVNGVPYCFRSDGLLITNQCNTVDGVLYYCDANGIATGINENGWNQMFGGRWLYCKNSKVYTGWLDLDGTWYYMDKYGIMQTGWLQLGDTWYYLKDNGVMATGWLQLGDSWYYLRDSGAMATGWLQLGDTWYYLKDNGVMATGWLQLGSTYYYLQDSGAMATGWLQLGDTWYYLDASGAMATGRVTVDGKEHDFSDSGVWLGEVVKYTGWVSENGTWYYYDAEGNPYEGWLQWEGKWYKFDENGKMHTGLVSDPNGYYYMNADGTMHTGWLQVEGYWYYFNENGTMHFGWLNLDGTWYAFNGFGMLLVGWFHDSAGNEYYSDSSGAMVTGRQYIDGRWHVFDSSGVKIS